MFPNAVFPPTVFPPQVFPRGYRLPVPHGREELSWQGGVVTEISWEGTADDASLAWQGVTVQGYGWEGETMTELAWQGGVVTGYAWEGTDDREHALRWGGVNDGRISWTGEPIEGCCVQESSDAARRRVPLLIDYTFQNADGVIDLTPYSSVKLLLKREGVLYEDEVAEFTDPKTTGHVFYDGYAFLVTGRWYAQFLAETAGGVPLYGDEIGFNVKPNLDDLAAEERPE